MEKGGNSRMLQPLRSQLLEIPGFQHGFFTREGGVSPEPWASLNTGFGKGDSDESVLKNYDRIAKTFCQDRSQIIVVKQVHQTTVLWVESQFWEPNGVWKMGQAPEADALVTRTPGLILGIRTADCAPVLMMDPKVPIIAVVHAGWKGTVKGLLSKTIELMIQKGAHPPRIRAVIGPCIHQDSYEVGPEFQEISECIPFLRPNKTGKFQLDLPGLIQKQIHDIGVSQIDRLIFDTVSDSQRFFSCRRAYQRNESSFGVQFSGIQIVSPGPSDQVIPFTLKFTG
jgi:YfiH family protein